MCKDLIIACDCAYMNSTLRTERNKLPGKGWGFLFCFVLFCFLGFFFYFIRGRFSYQFLISSVPGRQSCLGIARPNVGSELRKGEMF